MIRPFRIVLAALLLAVPSAVAQAADAIAVQAPWARASAGMVKTGAAYLTLRNTGTATDRLVGVSSPAAAKAELHTTIREGDVMRMRPVDAVTLPPGESAELKPGGLHVMLVDLKVPLKQGDSFPLTLRFEKGGQQTVTVAVQAAGAAGPAAHHGH